jgi:hypothetical protein
MTKYIIASLTKDAALCLPEGWTPYTLSPLASIGAPHDAARFDTMTEACLAIFTLETHRPNLCNGMNWIVVPMHGPEPQLYFPL